MDDSDSRQTSSTDNLALALSRSIPMSRLVSLLGDEDFDPLLAGKLYVENLRASSKLWIFFHLFEVLLRNSLSNQLLIMFPENPWWVEAEVLRAEERHSIKFARKHIAGRKAVIEIGDVIGNFSFGFWTELLAANYHQKLWEKGLYKAFPEYSGKRRDLHTSLERLRKLRNRIAHHELILNRDLDYDLRLLVSLIGYIEPGVRSALVENYNTVRC